MCRPKPVVLKFGGTSVGTPGALASALRVVRGEAERGRVVVVVSALSGVTDTLAASLEGASFGRLDLRRLVDSLGERHRSLLATVADGAILRNAEAALTLRLTDLQARLRDVGAPGGISPALRALVLASGERLAAPIVAAGLGSLGVASAVVDGSELIRTDDAFAHATVDLAATRSLVASRLGELGPGTVPVVTGFLGACPSGETTLLGRGGSDVTATAIGFALDAERVEIWSDVDGVLTADPRLVATAAVLAELTWTDAAALARGGARILHPSTTEPARAASFPVLVRNTFRPSTPGTVIGAECPSCPTAARALACSTRGAWAEIFVLEGALSGGVLVDSARRVLEEGGISPREVEEAPNGVVATVPEARHGAAVRLLHAGLVRPLPVVSLALAGPNGRVGRSFRSHLARHAGEIAAAVGIELRLVASFSRSRARFAPEGLHPEESAVSLSEADATPWEEAIDLLLAHGPRPLVLVDATASDDLAGLYARALESGVAIVTPNKRANARALHEFRRLQRLSSGGVPYLYGTTVGAGLPVLRNVRELTRAGDRVRGLRAVLSGTLSFVLSRVQDGVAFGVAVEEARRLGLTEPDPREDLSGVDVARKLLVILREAGLAVEATDLTVLALDDGDEADALWAGAAAEARGASARLVHVARWDEKGARVGVEVVPEDDVLARVRPGENVVVLETDRYATVPLTLSGPGAGPEVTAGNMLSELVSAAEVLRPEAVSGSGDRRRLRGAPRPEAVRAGA